MIKIRQRFTPLQRLLHWLMAACLLAMLFIGVGMVSSIMPKYLALVSIHKSLGIAILVLALICLGSACASVRPRCRPTCPSRSSSRPICCIFPRTLHRFVQRQHVCTMAPTLS